MTKLLPLFALAFLLTPSTMLITPSHVETGYGIVELEIESIGAPISTVVIGDCDALGISELTYSLWIAIPEGSPSTILTVTAIDDAGTSSQATINYDSSFPYNPSEGGGVDLIYTPPAHCFKSQIYMPVIFN